MCQRYDCQCSSNRSKSEWDYQPKYCSKEEYKKALSDYYDKEDRDFRQKNPDYDGDTGQNPYKR